jgi:hypothetical protein
VRSGEIVLGADDEQVVAARQLAAQFEGVDLRTGAVPREEIVNGVKDA